MVGIPTTAYEAVDQVEAEGKEIQRVFKHISCAIEADEAEAVSVTAINHLEFNILQLLIFIRLFDLL